MSQENIITLIISSAMGIWLTSCSIRAGGISDDPTQWDPMTKIAKASRILKIFFRRFLLALIAFAGSLHIVVSDFSLIIFAVIVLNLSIAWLVVIFYRDRTLRHVIHVHDKYDQLSIELKELKQSIKDNEPKPSNPLLNNL